MRKLRDLVLGHLRKASHHWTDIIPILMFNQDFAQLYISLNGYNFFIVMDKDENCCLLLPVFSSVNVTNQTFVMKHQACHPE